MPSEVFRSSRSKKGCHRLRQHRIRAGSFWFFVNPSHSTVNTFSWSWETGWTGH
jgi:hypothetical protein